MKKKINREPHNNIENIYSDHATYGHPKPPTSATICFQDSHIELELIPFAILSFYSFFLFVCYITRYVVFKQTKHCIIIV